MTESVPTPAAAAMPEKLNVTYIGIIGLASGLVSIFTVFAWPFALAVGFVIGISNAERARAVTQRSAVNLLRALVVVGGIILMLIFGAIIGGIIALAIVAFVAVGEQVMARTSSTDQAVGRIAILGLTLLVWLIVVIVLQVRITVGVT